MRAVEAGRVVPGKVKFKWIFLKCELHFSGTTGKADAK
jgi:hypothetical protein